VRGVRWSRCTGSTLTWTRAGCSASWLNGLIGEGFGVLRFSCRGHGRSDGGQQGARIAGEILDLQAAVCAAREGFRAPLSVVGGQLWRGVDLRVAAVPGRLVVITGAVERGAGPTPHVGRAELAVGS